MTITAAKVTTRLSAGQADRYDRPTALLTHPIVVVAIAALIVNDHFLKARFHNLLTGKLSDFAGSLFFPVVMVSFIELGRWALGSPNPVGNRRQLLLVAGVTTAVGFGAIQLWSPATEFYRAVASMAMLQPVQVVADPWDLIALPAAFVGWAYLSTATEQVG